MNQKFRFSSNFFLFLLAISFSMLGACSFLADSIRGLREEKNTPVNSISTRIYWNLSSGSLASESFRNVPGHLRYLVVHSLSNTEKIWQGEADLWETREDFQSSLPRGVYFPKFSLKGGLLTGPTKLEELESGSPKRISFFPSFHSLWEWEGDSFQVGFQNVSVKKNPISNWLLVFDFHSEGLAWVSKEIRNMGAGYQLFWENVRNRGTSLSTDFGHPSGLVSPFGDYDYRNQIFRSFSVPETSIPVWVFRKEGDQRWAWSLIPEDLLVSSGLSKRKQSGKLETVGSLFYDITNNNPFTARADLKDYPIILLKD